MRFASSDLVSRVGLMKRGASGTVQEINRNVIILSGVRSALAALSAGRAAAHHYRSLFYLACGRALRYSLQSVDPPGLLLYVIGRPG